MKFIIYFFFFFLSFLTASSQNLGIGTTNPLALLHVADSNVLFSGPPSVSGTTLYAPPVSGPGVRLMWYPQKAAFRAGGLDSAYGSVWNKDSIGIYSAVFGRNNAATGAYSFAAGNNNVASGNGAVAFNSFNRSIGAASATIGYGNVSAGQYSASIGYRNKAIGYATFCAGSENYADGDYSINMGGGNISSGKYSIAMGQGNSSLDEYSVSIGGFNQSRGKYSFAMGQSTRADGYGSFALGVSTIAKDTSCFVAGKYNDTLAANKIFDIGNGSVNSRSSAFTILKNGNVGVGTVTPALNSGGIGLQVLNNSFTQMKLQSGTSSAGLEFVSGSGKKYELQADYYGSFFLYDRSVNQYRLIVNSSGYLGIGNPSPSRPLSFPATYEKKVSFYPGVTGDYGIATSLNDLRIYADNANARISFGFDNYANGFTSRAYVTGSGSVALVVQGSLNVNGAMYNSDLRFKKNIQPIQNALDIIMALRGVTYQMRSQEFPDRNFRPGTAIGLIAQEVEAVLPELVSTDEKGYKSVDYAKLVPVLIESIKSQKDQLAMQEVQVKKQMEQNQKQQDKINELQQRLLELEKAMRQ